MPEPLNILVIEDDDSLREVLSFHLEEAGHAVDAASDGAQGLAQYDAERHDVVMTDLNMPGIDGMEVVSKLLERDPNAVVLVVTAYGSTEKAVEAMRRGAFHYVEKPVNSSALLAMVERAGLHRRAIRENAQLRESARSHEIITASPAMNKVLQVVEKVATSDAPVLITGESGTGKELVARTLHRAGDRADQPFVAVNCAAIPDELLESTLFGHERGAFTGATKSAPGKFVSASGGTIFLDEIAEMTPKLQSKLLRVLQEGEVDAVGSSEPRAIDVRVVSATHQNLEERIEAGQFREDLFYRLNVIPVRIPPLRERPEDIPVLFRFFMRKHEPGASIEVAPSVDDRLVAHEWTGNVRELENVVKRMLLLRNDDRLDVDDLPAEIRAHTDHADGLPFRLPEEGLDLVRLEESVIRAALAKHEGNQSATARYLNIPRHVLLYRIEKFDL